MEYYISFDHFYVEHMHSFKDFIRVGLHWGSFLYFIFIAFDNNGSRSVDKFQYGFLRKRGFNN